MGDTLTTEVRGAYSITASRRRPRAVICGDCALITPCPPPLGAAEVPTVVSPLRPYSTWYEHRRGIGNRAIAIAGAHGEIGLPEHSAEPRRKTGSEPAHGLMFLLSASIGA